MARKSADGPHHFSGFRPAAFQFLVDLAREQNRDWFQAHKAVYEAEVRGPMLDLVVDLGAALAARGLPLCGDPRSALFRINRDVRFSKDKSPYRTAAGAALTRDGQKTSPGVLYIHLDPARSFAAAGFYRPEPPLLGALRESIAARPKSYLALLDRLKAAGLALDPDEEALKRLPRGFDEPEAPEVAEALRRRSFILLKPLSLDDMAGRGLVEILADFAADSMPLLEFGWSAATRA